MSQGSSESTQAPLGRRWRGLLAVSVAMFCGAVALAQTANPPGSAQEAMQAVSQEMFNALDQNRAAIRKNQELVYPLVEKILIPRFDAAYAGKLVLGTHWASSTDEQHQRFIKALRHALTRLYGAAIADFSADRLKFTPTRGEPAGSEAVVRSIVTRASGTTVPVDYRLHLVNNQWLVYDVVIEGVSYVRNYRTDLGHEIDQNGLDSVIERLSKEGLGAPK